MDMSFDNTIDQLMEKAVVNTSSDKATVSEIERTIFTVK